MKITIAGSIRLLFVLTLVAISVSAETGLIAVSAPSPKPVRTTRIQEITHARDRRTSEESPHWRGRQWSEPDCRLRARARALPEIHNATL